MVASGKAGPALRRPAAGLTVICAAHFLIGVDGLAVAVALPTMQRDLAVDIGDVQWVLTAFGLCFGGLLLLGGRLGDLYGRRRVLVVGMGCSWPGRWRQDWHRC